MRQQKVFKLRYSPMVKAYFTLTANEAKMGAGDTSSIITGLGGTSINLPVGGTLSLGSLGPVYAGISRPTPYPLSLIPGVPQQTPALEYAPMLSTLRQIASVASFMVI